jgi:hypothetical protein
LAAGLGYQILQDLAMKRKREPQVRLILDKSKLCATEMKRMSEEIDLSVDCPSTSFVEWQKAFVQINKAAAQLERRMHLREQQHETELQLLREAMRNELIDREGNAARVTEKQRSLFESQVGTSSAQVKQFERLPLSAAATAQALSVLSAVSARASSAPDAIVSAA